MEESEDSGSRSGHGFYDELDYFWEMPNTTERCSSADLVILGKTYQISPVDDGKAERDAMKESNTVKPVHSSDKDAARVLASNQNIEVGGNIANKEPDTPLNNIKAFFNRFSGTAFDTSGYEQGKNGALPVTCPQAFLDDLYTRLWFTYRSGFPIIERDKNGPSPLSIGSILRGTLDVNNMGKGFTTDSGWGCMIRTSQSLLANALVSLKLGRDWNLGNSSPEDLEVHWEVVEKFADVPEAAYSIQNYVLYAAKYCGKRPGEWFGPSNAAKSIQKLCEEKQTDSNLKVYISTDSGDIFEDEILSLSKNNDERDFTPILILCGVRLGVQNINPVYWDFLKYLLQLPYSVGISGGRPSSSHYFFGYQSDYLFYLDPHVPQNAILLDDSGHINEKVKKKIFDTIHSKKLRKLHLGKIDPSMLIGFLVKTKAEYDDFKEKINSFDCTKKFISIHDSRPQIASLSSAGSELDGFIDLGVESINEEDELSDDGKERGAKTDPEEWREQLENANPSLQDKTEGMGTTDSFVPGGNIKEEAIVKVENNYTVDAFDLDCDPSQETTHGNTENEASPMAEESLVVVSGNDPIDLVVIENPDVEEH